VFAVHLTSIRPNNRGVERDTFDRNEGTTKMRDGTDATVEPFEGNERTTDYTKPAIKDYGSLQDLTAAGGAGLHDVPAGAPVTGPHGPGSTP
jgi:hypothetical protein